MQILSETYHVWGGVDHDWEDLWYDYYHDGVDTSEHEHLSYDRTSSTSPVSGSVSTDSGLWEYSDTLYASSSASRYAQIVLVDEEHPLRFATAFHIEEDAGPFKVWLFNDEALQNRARAFAELRVDFRLPGPDRIVEFATVDGPADFYYPHGQLAVLTDLTTGVSETLVSDGYGEPPYPYADPSGRIEILGTHAYRLNLQAGDQFTLGASDLTVAMLDVRVVPAPVPGAALLGVLGLSCAGWRLRRPTR
jgi:hypothetical protein